MMADYRIGMILGDRYLLRRVLNAGNMATVFLAFDRKEDRTVAVKVLHPHLVTTHAARFRHEATLARPLDHPNIVATYDDVREDHGVPYLVMEYIEGDTLAALSEREGAISPAVGIPLAVQICRGLAYAHERGVVHRDIKPTNIMVTPDGTAKMVDFGIARGPTSPVFTPTGLVCGTVHLMAPEVIRHGGSHATPHCDQYALGVVFFRMFTGRWPFHDDDSLKLAELHLRAPAPRPSAICSGIPPDLEAVLLRMLQKDPDDRYPSIAAVAEALEQVAAAAAAPSTLSFDREQEPTAAMHREPSPILEEKTVPFVMLSSTQEECPVGSVFSQMFRREYVRRAVLAAMAIGVVFMHWVMSSHQAEMLTWNSGEVVHFPAPGTRALLSSWAVVSMTFLLLTLSALSGGSEGKLPRPIFVGLVLLETYVGTINIVVGGTHLWGNQPETLAKLLLLEPEWAARGVTIFANGMFSAIAFTITYTLAKFLGAEFARDKTPTEAITYKVNSDLAAKIERDKARTNGSGR
ncbi:MAG: serine/threonine protein kinase [Chloroflexi bacterium]|nr:serine/threonine protein kinase [Chloroflexota bacterium]